MAAAPKPALDGIGWTYIGVTIGWTLVMITAMSFLWYHRLLPQLQMRRLPLVFVAMTMLHLYWTLCMIGYVVGPVAPCAAEYWVMSILVPFGIAIFQVANSQFIHCASQQKRYTSVQSLGDLVRGSRMKISALDGKSGPFWRRMMQRLRDMDKLSRMVAYVGVAMAVELALTIFIFCISEKFHPGWGLLQPDLLGTDAEVRVRCSRGWEWWLSIVWQFFWAWIYAPYILWKSRNIKDTHGWRIQTILCCIVGLPCSPLWLMALYLPQFTIINRVFVPPQWFSVSIFFIQSFTIFIPVYQVFRHHKLRTETLAAIANWEAKNKAFGGIGSLDSDSTKVASPTQLSFKSIDDSEKGFASHYKSRRDNVSLSSRKSHMFTMTALEHALRWNAEPLQNFAALKDFSGENISFLTHLTAWKKAWAQQGREKHSLKLPSEVRGSDETSLRSHFNRALRLYAAFVSPEHAEFPVNISSNTLKTLESIFGKATELLYGDTRSECSSNVAAPFLDAQTKSSIIIDMTAVPRPGSASSEKTFSSEAVWYWGDVPESFSGSIFDDAEHEIKYLVLTNTWPKFVNAGYAEQIQDGEGTTLTKRLSQAFFWKR